MSNRLTIRNSARHYPLFLAEPFCKAPIARSRGCLASLQYFVLSRMVASIGSADKPPKFNNFRGTPTSALRKYSTGSYLLLAPEPISATEKGLNIFLVILSEVEVSPIILFDMRRFLGATRNDHNSKSTVNCVQGDRMDVACITDTPFIPR